MRIAILISGQPRFMRHGAEWLKRNVLQHTNGFEVDYYVHFWDNGDPNLENKLISTYNPIAYKIDNFDNHINEFRESIIDLNRLYHDSFYLVPKYIRENILFDTPEITTYGQNFWGQFLSTHEVANLVKDYGSYDIVIKTRSDAIFSPMTPQLWHKSLSNLIKNPIFNKRIFVPWLHVTSGIPYFCDFAFISTPETWIRYSQNIKENCIRLATEDKPLLYEFNLHEFHGISHWLWNKLAIYNQTEFLSYTVTWPMNFSVSLIRDDTDILDKQYNDINQQFLETR